MTSSSFIDKDLDDAELWAVIDSAAASHSSTKSSRKPLAIKHNTNTSNNGNSSTTLSPTIFQSSMYSMPKTLKHSRSNLGEVVQEPYRSNKVLVRSGSIVEENRMVVVGGGGRQVVERSPLVRSPSPSVTYSSPSVGIGRLMVQEIEGSPVCGEESPAGSGGGWRSEEKENVGMDTRHSLLGQFPTVVAFKEYQNAAMAILEKTDYTMISGNPFIKKSGWRKISFFFNLSFEIKDKSIEFDEARNVQRAEFVVRAYMQGGRFSDGWGSCERREKRFLKPNHDIPSTAETRAKNKACQDLLGIGEYRPGAANTNR